MKIGINKKISESYKSVIAFMGKLFIFFGIGLFLPIISCLFYPEDIKQLSYFIIPGIVFVLMGALMHFGFKKYTDSQLTFRQDAIIVLLLWIIAPISSALPFVLSGNLTFPYAFFEAVSGWTTTGLSVVDVSTIPKIFLLHRSFTLFFGGVGIVLVVLSVLSSGFGVRLFVSEGHDKVLPNLAKTTRVILGIYSGYCLIGTVLYVLAGVPLFDAINHSIAALSTGGFSTQVDGVMHFNNDQVYLITLFLMICGALGFGNLLLLIKGKFKAFGRVSEIRLFFLIIFIVVPLVTFFGLNQFYGSLGEGFKYGLFNAISAITTTGFNYGSMNAWYAVPFVGIVLLMLIGGCIGSTSGGIKVYRVLVMIRNAFWSISKNLKPERLINENYVWKADGKEYLDNKLVSKAGSYIFVYLALFLTGSIVLMAHGYGFQESLFEFASALGTVGLSVGITSPDMPMGVLWTEVIGMIFGRLEIYIIFIAILKIVKDGKKLFSIRK